MSFLKTALEKKIKELRISIDAQKTELAAYEQVLALETGKPVLAAAEEHAAAPAHKAPAPAPAKKSPAKTKAAAKTAPPPKPAPVAAGSPLSAVPFNGNRTDFVMSLLRHRGAAGIAPYEIADQFKARKIAISKNLIYNALSLMFTQKKVRKVEGRYYLVGTPAAAPAVSKPAAPAEKKKSRISAEGMRRIIEANKKRWAAKKKS